MFNNYFSWDLKFESNIKWNKIDLAFLQWSRHSHNIELGCVGKNERVKVHVYATSTAG